MPTLRRLISAVTIALTVASCGYRGALSLPATRFLQSSGLARSSTFPQMVSK